MNVKLSQQDVTKFAVPSGRIEIRLKRISGSGMAKRIAIKTWGLFPKLGLFCFVHLVTFAYGPSVVC